MGDGEINAVALSGKATLFAAHHRLSNLVVIVDANGQQALGSTDQVMRLGSIAGKFAAFDWVTADVDGHDEKALSASLDNLMQTDSTAPRVLVARTVKGKGVSFMENDNSWHYRKLNDVAYQAAVAELCL